MSSGQRARQRWMIYALGGGAGHLTRVTAFARAALRQLPHTPETQNAVPVEICILTNSPFARVIPVARELKDGHRLIQLDSHLSRGEVAAAVCDILGSQTFDVLVVDTFPRGLAGELPEILTNLNCPRVLINRDLNPKYVAQYDVEAVARDYDLILVPGESAAFDTMAQAVITAPWLIRDCDQLLSVAEALSVLNVADQSIPVVAVVGSGTEVEIQEMELLATELDAEFGSVARIRFVAPCLCDAPDNRLCIWPLLEALPAISIMIGGGGYNTVNEVKATETHFIGIARERLYDRQERRLADFGHLNSVADVAERMGAILAHGIEPLEKPTYVNGVHQAVQSTIQLLEQMSAG